MKLERIQREFGVTSHIVLISFGDHSERMDMFQQVLRAKRGPDMIWAIESFLDRSFIINLMPLAGSATIEGYIVRVQTLLRAAGDGNLALMECFDAVTGSPRYVICAVGRDDGDYVFTPFGHLANGNPYDAYLPPDPGDPEGFVRPDAGEAP